MLDCRMCARAHVTTLNFQGTGNEAMAAGATRDMQLTRHALDQAPCDQAHWQGLDLHFLPFFTLLTAVVMQGPATP
jgi:hypothetical protein